MLVPDAGHRWLPEAAWGTDFIDLFQLHGFDAMTPTEEVVGTLDDLVKAGKIRYVGCSNFSGWHLMLPLAVSDKFGLGALLRQHQVYYSLVGREYEWEDRCRWLWIRKSGP